MNGGPHAVRIRCTAHDTVGGCRHFGDAGPIRN